MPFRHCCTMWFSEAFSFLVLYPGFLYTPTISSVCLIGKGKKTFVMERRVGCILLPMFVDGSTFNVKMYGSKISAAYK